MHRRQVLRRLREEVEVEPEDAVRAQLRQHRGQDHRPARRRLPVGVRRPRVQREERRLDRERRGERQEQQDAGRAGEVRVLERRQRERQHAGLALVQERDHQDADEQERRAQERVDEELHRRVRPAGVAPAADDEVRRHQRHLEEEEEQDQVEREEAADARRLEHEHPGDVGRRVLLRPGADEHDREQHRGQQQQEQRDPVDPEVPADADPLGPDVVRDELVARHVGMEQHRHADREAEDGHRHRDAEALDQPAVGLGHAAEQRHRDRPGERQQDEERQVREARRVAHDHHVRETMKTMIAARPSAMPRA